MPLEKLTNRVSFMPPRPIDIKPDGVSPEAGREMPQDFQEPLTVPAWGPDHAHAAQQRRHPARDVEALPMLTRGGHAQPLTELRPAKPQPGMEGESRFILKDQGLGRS